MFKAAFRNLALLAVVAGAPIFASPALAATATVELGPANITAGAAKFDVSVLFSGAAGDQIEAVQLAVTGSSANLTGAGTDFTRFSFAVDPATIPGWFELAPISGGVSLLVAGDPVTGPFLHPAAGAQRIGTLSVSLAGLAEGTPFVVTLAGGEPGLGTDVGGTIGGDLVPSFSASAANTINFSQPDGVQATVPTTTTIPEPATAGAALLLVAGWMGRRGRAGSYRVN